MKTKKSLNTKLYGVIALFVLLVVVVEIIKTVKDSTISQVIEQNQDTHALIALPLFSIAVVLLLAIPRKNF